MAYEAERRAPPPRAACHGTGGPVARRTRGRPHRDPAGPARWNTIVGMTATKDTRHSASTHPADGSDATTQGISVLLFSSDRAVRDAVRLGVGDQPADDVRITRWHECATSPAVLSSVQEEEFDVLILDGEAQPYGGMGISRQLKNEIFRCPPIIVLTGRAVDGWLATWSLADAAVSRPFDPQRLATAVADLARR